MMYQQVFLNFFFWDAEKIDVRKNSPKGHLGVLAVHLLGCLQTKSGKYFPASP